MARLTLKPVRRFCAIGLVSLGLSAASPQPPLLAPEDQNETLVSDLVVSSVQPGPAYWRAQKAGSGESTVWIMGIPSGLPKSVSWNTNETRRHLKGASRLILGPDQQVGNIFSLMWIFLTQRKSFTTEEPLEKTVPPHLYARLQKALPAGRNRDASHMRPILAALGVAVKFNRGLDIEQREPERAVRRMALFQVKSERAGETVALDFVRLLQSMPRDVELTCLDDSLNQAEAGRDRAMAAAKGWARGDLREAVSAQRGWERCIAKDREIAAITERNVQAATDAIIRALEQPGKAVALVELRPLLAQRGVIVRLRERGVVITPPDVPGIEEAEEAEVQK